jgi:PleD family two-component response regulator
MELVQPDSSFSSARILVVDNEVANVRTLSRILQAAGYTNIVATTDPTMVRTLFAEQEPDLVLLDLHMPVLDGVACWSGWPGWPPRALCGASPGCRMRPAAAGRIG